MRTIFIFIYFLTSISLWAVQRDLYVSTKGNDHALGTREDPLGSIQVAWELIQGDTISDRFVVWVQDGRYEIEKTIELIQLQEMVSDNKRVIIKAIHPHRVVISGGKSLPSSAWKRLQKGDVFNLLTSAARKRVKQINLDALGISDYGTMKGRGFSQNVRPMEMELFFNDKRMQLARWPNYDIDADYEGKVQYGKVIEEGSKPRFGDASNKPAKFIFENERIKAWSLNEDVWLHGIWAWDWADRRMRLLDVDTSKSELTVDCSFYGLKPNRYFYVVNAVAELDSPGEYYIDRKRGLLYFWPPAPLTESEVAVSLLENPLLVLENVSNVTVEGIVFQEGRSVGVNVVGGENNLLDNCIVRCVGSAAINIGEGQEGREIIGIGYGGGNTGLYEDTGWNRNGGVNNGVRNSEIYDIAAYGVLLGGGDRKTLSPAGNFVENCNIHHVARVYEQMFSNIHIDGVGNRVSNCDLSYNPHSAIMFWGNNHLIEYNEIHHCVYNSSDAGAIYSGRDPSQTGTLIRWNFFHNICGNGDFEGIFFDDGVSGMRVCGNVFHGIQSRGAVKYHGGQNNEFTNNIVVDCISPVDYQLWNQSKWNDFLNSELLKKRLFDAVDILQDPYLKSYPWLSRIFDVPYTQSSHIEERNYVTTIDDQLFENGKENDFRISDWQALRERVSGFQVIPVEKIGLREKPRRLLSPVFYLKTKRLFPGQQFEIGPSKILEGKGEYEIFYTIDGSEPTKASKLYSKPLVMSAPAEIKARIYQKGLSDDLASNVKVQKCEKPKGIIYLDELYPVSVIAHNGLIMNRNYAFSNRVYLGGSPYVHSVMACPTKDEKCSELVYDLSFIEGKITFLSDYGIDAASKRGSSEFVVKVRKNKITKEIFRSEKMAGGGNVKSFELDISGSDQLMLIATDGGDGPSGDHSVWGNARLDVEDRWK